MEENYSDIEKLAELRDKGVLTEQEFQQKKSQILGTPIIPKKKNSGCGKAILFFIIGSSILGTLIGIFSSVDATTNETQVEQTQTTQHEELLSLEKELENKELTKVQREEIEIEIKSIKSLQWAKKNINVWDNSNPKLERAVKKAMRNPKSYEHIATEFSYKKNNVTAIMQYRGENGFGGTSIEKVKGVFDYDGNLLEISKEE